MEGVQTFVFFDTETTGLPYYQNNRTNIVELAFVAVKRDNILNRSGVHQPEDTMTMRFKPKILMDPIAEIKTGITNASLSSEKSFDSDTTTEINNFLNKLQAPICLIAHNGFGFDYPIFNAELIASQINSNGDVLCIDSLPMFRQFHEDDNVKENRSQNSATVNKTSKRRSKNSYNPYKAAYGKSKNKQNMTLFTLKDIHTRFFNCPPENAHRAENDCLILLKCCMERAAEFIHWCETKSVLIKDIPHMAPGKKLHFYPQQTHFREFWLQQVKTQ